MIELTMHASNPAREFYRRAGFELVDHGLHYVAARTVLVRLVAGPEGELRSPQSDGRARV